MPTTRLSQGFGLLMQLQFAVLGLVTCLFATREVDSVVYYAVQISRPWGYVTVAVMLACSVALLLDVALYQLLRLQWPSVRVVRGARHLFGLGLAGSWVAILAQSAARFDTSGLFSVYSVLAVFLCVSLVKDALNERAARRRQHEVRS